MTPFGKRAAAALLFFGLAGCAGTPAPDSAGTAPVASEVAVVRDGDVWTADFRFNRKSPAWFFHRSALARVDRQPWRLRSWSVETPGVRLERHGFRDVLVAERGNVPERVRIRFTPFSQDLIADYEPALTFTDGSVALFTEQFEALPIASAEVAARLPLDLNSVDLPEAPARITLRDASSEVLHAGRRVRAATFTGSGGGAYVLFGPGEQVDSEAIATVLDPGLPAWLRRELAETTPALLARYAGALGPLEGGRPTLLVSWAGPTPRMRSMSGSTLRAMIIMTFEGESFLEQTDAVRHGARWFIAHEAAHFWLGRTTVRYELARDAWIFEGGADLLAIRVIEATDPTYAALAELQREVDDCILLSAGRGVASAAERNEHRALYACGAVFGLVAEAASRQPFDRFVRGLIDANRADGVLTRAEWLAELDRVSGDPSLSRDIAVLLDDGAADPKTMIASLFTRAGVRFAPGEDGIARLR